MTKKINFLDLNKQYLSIKSDVDQAIQDTLSNSSYIGGKALDEFQANFSEYQETNHCIGVGNGTDALEIAIKSLDLPEDSEIITQSNTFVATCLGILNNFTGI